MDKKTKIINSIILSVIVVLILFYIGYTKIPQKFVENPPNYHQLSQSGQAEIDKMIVDSNVELRNVAVQGYLSRQLIYSPIKAIVLVIIFYFILSISDRKEKDSH